MPNETIHGEEKLKECGLDLEIIRHPVTLYNDSMNLECSDLIKYGIHKKILPRDLHKFEASLLTSWIDMLKTYKDCGDEYILFAESDILPMRKMSYDMLINEESKKYDIIRPFNYLDVQPISPLCPTTNDIKWYDGYNFLKGEYKTVVRHPYNRYRYKCGTHALIASQKGIEKLIKIFEELVAPADVSLEYGILFKEISVAISNYNFFAQYNRPSWNEFSPRHKNNNNNIDKRQLCINRDRRWNIKK